MLEPSRRAVLDALLIGLALLLTAALDLLLPGNYIVFSLFAIPMLIAALTVKPRGVAITALAALALAAAGAVLHHPPLIVTFSRLLGVGAIGGLAVLLARQRERATLRWMEREHARRQVTEILESIGDGFFALDRASRFTYVNQHAEQFFGRDRASLIGKPAWEQFPAESRIAFGSAVSQAASNHDPVLADTYISSADKWYVIRTYPSATGVSVYFRDITNRKKAEEGWREAEAKYRSLVEQVPAVTYRVVKQLGNATAEPVAEYISPQFEAMLGHKVDDWIEHPKNWANHLHPDDRDRVLKANARANETGDPYRIEYRLIAADGTPVWVRDEAAIVAAEDMNRLVWQGIMLDITAQKEAEAERAETSRKFAFLAETSRQLTATQPDFGATVKQIADLIVPELADCTIVYLVEGTAMRRVALALCHSDDAPLAAQLDAKPVTVHTWRRISKILEAGQVLYLPPVESADDLHAVLSLEERELITESLPASTILMPIRARDNLLGALLMARHGDTPPYTQEDVIFIEEVVHRFGLILDNARLYEEARKALAAREEFLSVAAHELRTPLTGIKGYVQLLERRLNREPQSLDTIRKTLDNLRSPLRRFERIVEDLLEVTRIENNQLSVHKEECDLALIATNVFEAMFDSDEAPLSQPTNLIVPESLTGYWDPTRIAQVIENLLSNAVRYSLGRGEVELRVAREGDIAIISTRDQGIGLSQEEQRHVFDPFYRGDALAGKVEGSGLGLAITKRIVEQHGGTISVESVVGQGSTFTVRLPVNLMTKVLTIPPLIEDVARL